MVITLLLNHGKGIILLCMISILTGSIPDLLQQGLPGSAKHESAISVEVNGMYLYLNNLLNQGTHTPFYLSHSVMLNCMLSGTTCSPNGAPMQTDAYFQVLTMA